MGRSLIFTTITLSFCLVTANSLQANSQSKTLAVNSPSVKPVTTENSLLSLVGRWPYGSCKAVYVSDDYAYISNGCVMSVLDISDPASPKWIGEVETPGIIRDIYIWRHYAYVANGRDGLRVIDVSNPSNPVEVGNMPMASCIALTGSRGLIYASNGRNVAIINVTAPTGPELIYSINTYENNWDVSLLLKNSRKYLCIANAITGLRILDVTDTYDMAEVITFDTLGSVRDVFVSGNYVYVASYNKMFIIDLNDPMNPEIIGSCNTPYQFCNIFVDEGYAYITDELHGGLWIVDVSNPEYPVIKGNLNLNRGGSEGIFVKNQVAYVAHGSGGMQIMDVSLPTKPQIVSIFNSGNYLENIIVVEDYAYTIGGTSLVIFDVSNPAHPDYHSSLLIDESYIVDLNISGAYAYAVGYFGLGIIDISDPDNPAVIGEYQIKNAWSVYVKDQYAYMTTSDGFHVIDVSNKTNPQRVWLYSTENPANAVNVDGYYAYLTESNEGFKVFDISNPVNPVLIGHLKSTIYMNQIHLSETYAYVGARHNGMKIIDVSAPDNPREVSLFKGGFYWAGDLYVNNNFAYVTDGINGLRVIDVTLPENMKETARFKTGGFATDIFVSGNLIYLTGGDSGLYILKNENADDSEHITTQFSLIQNFPNPFNAVTHIQFILSSPARVTLTLYDTKGRELETLIDDVLYNRGFFELNWNGNQLPSGVYIYHFQAGDHIEAKKMLLVR